MALVGRILWTAFTYTNYIKGICSYCFVYFWIGISGFIVRIISWKSFYSLSVLVVVISNVYWTWLSPELVLWLIIHQIFSLVSDWSKCVTWTNIPPAAKTGEYKTGEYPRIFPNFQNCACCIKDLKDNKHNSLHLGQKYARIFVLGHYLFLVAHSFPRATLSENSSLLGTDNVHRQISLAYFLAKWRLLFI